MGSALRSFAGGDEGELLAMGDMAKQEYGDEEVRLMLVGTTFEKRLMTELRYRSEHEILVEHERPTAMHDTRARMASELDVRPPPKLGH